MSEPKQPDHAFVPHPADRLFPGLRGMCLCCGEPRSAHEEPKIDMAMAASEQRSADYEGGYGDGREEAGREVARLRKALSRIVQDADSYQTGDPLHVSWAKSALVKPDPDPFDVQAGIDLLEATRQRDRALDLLENMFCGNPALRLFRNEAVTILRETGRLK